MAIVFNTPTSVAIQGATTATVSHTVPSGSNRVLWVIASCYNSVDYLASSTATYGGVSLGSPIFADTAAASKTTYIWQLASPTVGTANVIVTPSASAHLDVWVINANGVDLANLPTSASVSLAPLNPSSPTSYAVTTPSGGANLGYFLHREAATSGITPITGFSLVGTAPASSFGQTRLATAQGATNHGWTWTGTGGVTTIAQMSVQIRAASTGPTLTASANTVITATTATGNVSTDTATGTLYTAVTTSATPPTVAAIQAGTGFVFAANQAISSIGGKTFAVTGLSASTVYYEYYQQNNGASVDSTVVGAASFTTSAAGGPALTSPTGTSTGSTTASGTVSTDTANGTLYRLASINTTETAATIKAAALSQTVTATGVQNVTFTGLTASTVYYAHYVHTNASAVDSAVANSASFTTAAAGATIAGEAIKNNTGTLQAAVTIPKVAFIRLSDMANVLTLTNQVTNASGLLSISNAALVSGVAYLRVLSDATGANVGIAAYTAV